MLNNILYRFSDGWDVITLGQVTPTLYMLSEDRQLWKKLCQYHFAEKQVIHYHVQTVAFVFATWYITMKCDLTLWGNSGSAQ